jgi:hypothetical protein
MKWGAVKYGFFSGEKEKIAPKRQKKAKIAFVGRFF